MADVTWKTIFITKLFSPFWIHNELVKTCSDFVPHSVTLGVLDMGGDGNIVWLSSVGWSLPVVFRDTVRTIWWLGSNELKWITFSGLVGSNNTYQVPLLTPTGDPKIHIDALSLFVQFLRYQETKQLFKESKNKSAEKRWELLWESISAQTLQLF